MIIDTTSKSNITTSTSYLTPMGLAWDQNSCAYDSILCIIHSLWLFNKPIWNDWLRQLNNIQLKKLCLDFEKVDINIETLSSTRDRLRHRLQKISNQKFPWGGFAAIEDVLCYILETNSITFDSIITCPHSTRSADIQHTTCLLTSHITIIPSIGHWINNITEFSDYRCNLCHDNIDRKSVV